MLGHAAIAEAAIADVGGVLLLATAEMNALGTSSSIGSGTLVGVSSLSGNFTKTTAGIFITGSVNAEVSSSFTQTTENIKIVNFTDATLSTEFTQTAAGIIIASGVVTKDATTETYTEITPSGTETWTEITPSGAETWTEIEA